MIQLKLIALDAADVPILSAHLQDAVVRVSDIAYSSRDRRFAAHCNRYNWQDTSAVKNGSGGERRRAALRIERVTAVQSQGFDPAAPQTVLSILAITFTPDAAHPPAGIVTIVCAGGATLRFTVECPEMVLEDLGPAWQASHQPVHPD